MSHLKCNKPSNITKIFCLLNLQSSRGDRHTINHNTVRTVEIHWQVPLLSTVSLFLSFY